MLTLYSIEGSDSSQQVLQSLSSGFLLPEECPSPCRWCHIRSVLKDLVGRSHHRHQSGWKCHFRLSLLGVAWDKRPRFVDIGHIMVFVIVRSKVLSASLSLDSPSLGDECSSHMDKVPVTMLRGGRSESSAGHSSKICCGEGRSTLSQPYRAMFYHFTCMYIHVCCNR